MTMVLMTWWRVTVLLSLMVLLGGMVQGRHLYGDNLLTNDIKTILAPSTTTTLASKSWVRMIDGDDVDNVIKVSKHTLDPLEMECVSYGTPPPQLQWFKERMRLTPVAHSNDFEYTNYIDSYPNEAFAKLHSRLYVNHALSLHNGRYTCLAQSGGGGGAIQQNATKVYDVNVKADSVIDQMSIDQLVQIGVVGAKYKPRITLWAESYLDKMDSGAVLPCRAVGNPKPKITWYGPDQKEILFADQFRRGIVQLPDGSLSFRRLMWKDMGQYTCVVNNTLGMDQIDTFLYPVKP